jgi:predicted glutamine amidotransferase
MQLMADKQRLSVSKQVAQQFDMERFKLKMLNDVEIKEQHWIKTSNRFVALENLDDDLDINRTWESIRM